METVETMCSVAVEGQIESMGVRATMFFLAVKRVMFCTARMVVTPCEVAAAVIASTVAIQQIH